MAEYAIESEGLTKRFRISGKHATDSGWFKSLFTPEYITALDKVSLRIKENEVFGLMGANGAGKTTLLKVLCTLILPSSGSAKVGGFDVVRQDGKVREITALIQMSQRSFYWRLTGTQNLEFFGTLYNIPLKKLKTRINEVLEGVELCDVAWERIVYYSSGMMYRLAIARGLLPDPPIIFMDEPTLGLDLHSSKKIRDFIKEKLVGESGKTVVLATNNSSEAELLCDRFAVLNKGAVLSVESMSELRRAGKSVDEVLLDYMGGS